MAASEGEFPGNLSVRRKNHFKVRARALGGIVASLRAQVKELEQQRDFLSKWKADMHTGADVEGSLVDIEFQGWDGDRIHAHRAVLAAKSSEFEALFRADTEGKIVWDLDMPYEPMKAFITFFYTGRVSPTVLAGNMISLLDAADKYNVQLLKLVCEDTLVNNVTRDNAITTFDIAKKRCSSACKEAVLSKASSLGELSSFSEYKVFTRTDPGLLLELYEQLTNRPVQSPRKRQKVVTENGNELPNGVVPISEGDNNKSETDEEESVDDDDTKPGVDAVQAPYMQSNGVPQFGRPMYWQGPPMAGQPFPPAGFENAGFHHRGGLMPSPYDGSMMPRPPYGMPPFMPPMYPGGAMPMGFMGGTTPPLFGPPERPAAVEEVADKEKVQPQGEEPKKRKKREKRCLMKGVKLSRNKARKYIAIITVKGKNVDLGRCRTEEEAGHLYDRAAFVVGRKPNRELPDDEKEELKGISWDDFIASVQEVKALQKIQGKLESGDVNDIDQDHEQGDAQEREQVLSYTSEHSSP